MHFKTLAAAFLSALHLQLLNLASAEILDAGFYAINLAPAQLDRLSTYGATRDLSPAQSAFIKRVESAVLNFEVAQAASLEEGCASLFDAGECAFILAGKEASPDGHIAADKRQSICKCSRESDWCDKGSCVRVSPDCWFASSGCGTLFWYSCDGMCR